MKIRGKLLVTFIMILALMVLLGIFFVYTLDNVYKTGNEVQENWQTINFISEKEVDHLHWVNDLLESILLAREFTGQLDHTKCNFGQSYYSTINSEEYDLLP